MAEPTEGAATPPADRGSLTLGDKVVEKVATAAAREIGAVTDRAAGWRRVAGQSLPRASAEVAGGHTRINVQVAVAWPTPLAEVAEQTRDHVRERVTTLTGTTVVAVDVTVADVVHLETAKQRVR